MKQTFTLKILLSALLMLLGLSSTFSQIEMKLQLLQNDTSRWGVYVKHNGSVASPSDNIDVGSAQVTIVAPTGFDFTNMQNVNGVWAQNARVNAPVENPAYDYIDVGYLSSFPNDVLFDTTEILLFTFEKVGPCPDTLYLMDHGDPFYAPNSAGNNPGNNFDAIDKGYLPSLFLYGWVGNYGYSAWSCGDCDGDGILDAQEDTNGDGNYDPISEDLNMNGIFDLPGEDLDGDGRFDIIPDSSGLCDICDPIHPELAVIRGDTTMCSSEDNTDIYVDIDGGWPPYVVTYENDAGTDFVVNNYRTGDPINIILTATDTFELVSIVDSSGCVVDSMAGQAIIVIEGPLAVDANPTDVTECVGNATSFTAPSSNGGASLIEYNWQISMNGVGGPYIDLMSGTPYSNVNSNTLNISDVDGLNAMHYRLAIFTEYCDTVYSTGAILNVEGPIVLDLEPRDTSICNNETAQFYSEASALLGTVSGSWEYSTDGGATWLAASGADFVGTTTDELTVSNTRTYSDNLFRRAYTTPTCSVVNSAEALLTVEGPIVIVDEPDDILECSAQALEFIVGVENQSLSANSGIIQYQWQVSTDNELNWTNLNNGPDYNGTKSDSLTVDVSVPVNGNYYRVIAWTAECSRDTSRHALIEISDGAEFNLEPQDIDICDGQTHTFTSGATVAQGAFDFAWQVSIDGGTTFTDVADGASTGGVLYSGATTSDLTMTDISYLQNQFLYRVEARTHSCGAVSSVAALLSVEGPLSVNVQPINDTICRNDQAIFDIVIDNPGHGTPEYQWQLKPVGGTTWVDLPNTSPVYNGVFTDRLSVNTDQGGNDRDSFRVLVNTPTCVAIVSDAVELIIEGPFTFSDMPNDTTVCSGNEAEFFALAESANSGDFIYKWEISQDTVNYTELTDGGVYAGTDTRHLEISDVTGMYDYRFRLKVRSGECDWVISEFASLTVEGPFDINPDGQPDDITLCQEGNAQIFAGVTNDGSGEVLYQWEIKRASDALGWVDLMNDTIYNGVSTDTVSIAPVMEEMNGDSLRVRIWTGTCAVTISDGARVSIEGAIEITAEPVHDTICSGGVAQFDISFTNGAAGTPVWQWQVSTDAGATWADVDSGVDPVYSGVNSPNLTITGADHTYNQNWYRIAYFFPTCGVDYSDDAILTVEGAISVTNQPIDVISCDAEDVVFYVSTQNLGGGTLEFQWQRDEGDGAGWVDLVNNGPNAFNGVYTAILQQGEIDTDNDGDRFRVLIQTGECTTIMSGEALLNVEGPLEFTNHPDDITVCSGGDTTMVVAFTNPGAGTPDVQWRYSPNGIVYSDVPDNAVFDDVTTTTLTINDVAGLGGYYFLAEISTSTCPVVASEAAILEVEGPLSATDPTPITDCADNSVVFTTSVGNPGAGTVQYQWEMNRGNGWMDLVTNADSFFNGVRTDTLSVSDINSDTLNNAQFRVRIWTSTCNFIWTNPATLTIEGPISFTDMPNDTIVCSGEPASFDIMADNGTGGTIDYQWQVSTNGVNWTDLTNTAPYSDVNTRKLQISDVAGLYERKYRCAISTNSCDVKYSDPARLTVEGPVVFADQPDSLIACRNEVYFFETDVVNQGAGVMSFQWEVQDVPGGTWGDLNDDTWVHGTNTTLLQLDSMDIMQTRGDTVFRLRVNLPTCNDFYSQIVLLQIVSDTLGFCDFDLDGEINDIDEDDDNDGLDDVWEYSCLNYGQFNMDVDMDGDDDGDEDWDGDGISNQEETDGDGVLDGNPCDPCDPLISSACFGISLDVKALLYGPSFSGFSTINDEMNTKLNDQNLIPLIEPYTGLSYRGVENGVLVDSIKPFKHYGPGGGETITDPAVLAVTGSDRIVDWVFVELRHANKIDSIVATHSALIQADGDVVSVDGVSPVTFDTTVVAGEYYVALRHRNHLGVMTVDAPELSPDLRTVDFKDTSIVRNGNHPQYNIDLTGQKSKYNYMWAGDLRPDGRVIYQGPNNDITQIFLKVISDPNNVTGPNGGPNANHIITGYLLEDFNLDGTSIYQGPNNDRNMVLFNSVLVHPGNENKLANYIVLEQLP